MNRCIDEGVSRRQCGDCKGLRMVVGVITERTPEEMKASGQPQLSYGDWCLHCDGPVTDDPQ
jgi:hypothetical protein